MIGPRTATMTVFQLLGTMISTLQTMQDTILILGSFFVRRTAVPIVTILTGLEHNIFLQMSWRFITKFLLETGRHHKRKAKNKNKNNSHKKNINKPTKIRNSKK